MPKTKKKPSALHNQREMTSGNDSAPVTYPQTVVDSDSTLAKGSEISLAAEIVGEIMAETGAEMMCSASPSPPVVEPTLPSVGRVIRKRPHSVETETGQYLGRDGVKLAAAEYLRPVGKQQCGTANTHCSSGLLSAALS